MAYEREVKMRVDCSRLERVKEILLGHGAVVKASRRETDIYYQHPCRDLAATDEAFRLRLVDGRGESLTYKGPRISSRGGVKERKEIIVELAGGPVGELLEELGFKPAVTVEKEREYLEYRGHTFTLDRVRGLGCFIEIEGDEPDRLARWLESEGVRGEPVEKTYAEMVLDSLGRVNP